MLRAAGINVRLYIRILFSISLCIVLTLFVSSTILFVIFARISSGQTYDYDIESLAKTSREVSNMTDNAQALSFQIYRDYAIVKLLYYPSPDIYDFMAAMGQLDTYRSSMSFIDSIYVINGKSDNVIVNARSGQNGVIAAGELEDKDILRVLDHFQDYAPFAPIPRHYSRTSSRGDQQVEVYSYLCYDAIGSNNRLNSAIVVNIDASCSQRGDQISPLSASERKGSGHESAP